MRLHILSCCRIRRRRITWLLGLLFLLVGSSWVTLLVLQARQEGLALNSQQQQTLTAVDYDVFNSDSVRERRRHHNSNSFTSNVGNNTMQKLALTNGRLPKGLDVVPSALERQNNTARHKSSLPSSHRNAPSPPHLSSERTLEMIEEGTNVSTLSPHHNTANRLNEQFTLDLLPSQMGPDSIQLLRDHIARLNQEQTVLNTDKFPPLADDDGIVLIVQVHRREGYLEQLFNSMRSVHGIENVLLVISHDYYYDDIMKLVQTVDFCRVTQIFYPFSLQVYPDTFPGPSKDDCPRDSTKEEAQAMNCTNSEHPDSYGHYREAKITAVKHHWWWKVNMVFDGMQATRNFSGYVLFLEEDHYLSPDFLFMTEKLIEMKDRQCLDCDFINLGMYTNMKSPAVYAHRVSVGIWNAGKNNMGFGMYRKTWEQMKACKEHFCTYDDYNWDWSINSMGQSCLQRHLKVMVSKAPRIFHIGNCGVHHTKECNEDRDAQKVARKLEAQKDSLFPESLHLDLGLNPIASRKKVKPYGGWGDVRDWQLCLSFVGNALRNSL